MSGANYARDAKPDADGRWPANLIHDGGEEVIGLFGTAARFFTAPRRVRRIETKDWKICRPPKINTNAFGKWNRG